MAVFAGGCFWCVEHDFDEVPGVTATISGFAASTEGKAHPSYKEVSSGQTPYVEAVLVAFDPEIVSYSSLVDFFWRHCDPTRNDGQFCDKGMQYRPVIFYKNDSQKLAAQHSKEALIKADVIKPIAVEVLPLVAFYPAEEYHQNFYKKNPLRYKFYRWNCGRDKRIKELWG